ncbi:non-specific lipid transfer protein GPI-anchored 5 isoform X1 [Nicotiana tabacum]|uniref:Non-specific lipid transfer protein GPI-anchored 2 isoform X1 n=2 Tax=Nicotiana TaxID=4085 RepID=A0A1S4C5E8_TOBAC|nr:PREDICTED: non-specific lipid transfer protein GPI-anchored 2-like isoform X1 [Nicotiana sylvestris]XP_016496427.1 PREDICTED: non-specific lipid transfer protein GPI-anchored 2-like isoform X1 [Nicotiana tabacum]
MASQGTVIFMALVLIVTMISVEVMAQSDCTSTLLTMASCLNFVTGSAETPSASCCSALSGVLQSKPRCLCLIVIGGGSSLGVQINQTQALALPAACKLETPPVSKCNAGNGPVMSPEGAPTEGTPDSSTGIAVSGSKAAGSSNTSDGSPLKVPVQVVVSILLFMASYVVMI